MTSQDAAGAGFDADVRACAARLRGLMATALPHYGHAGNRPVAYWDSVLKAAAAEAGYRVYHMPTSADHIIDHFEDINVMLEIAGVRRPVLFIVDADALAAKKWADEHTATRAKNYASFALREHPYAVYIEVNSAPAPHDISVAAVPSAKAPPPRTFNLG